MARFVLDTTVLVDHLRGKVEATAWLLGLDEVPLCSEVSRAEVLVGVRAAERRTVEVLFDTVDWVPVNEAVARRAGDLGRRYRRSHHLGIADLLVAATVQEHKGRLATSNLKHYPMFARLARPY